MKVFGIPIILSIFLGFMFPYYALSYIPIAFLMLFLLMFFSSLDINKTQVLYYLKNPFDLCLANFIIFVVIPLIQCFIFTSFINDKHLLLALLLVILSPSAIVAPFFTDMLKGDKNLSFLIMLSSTLICPLTIPGMLKLFQIEEIHIQFIPIFKFLLLLVTIPLFLGFLIKLFFPTLSIHLSKCKPQANVIFLSTLIFIFVGSSMGKINYYSLTIENIMLVTLIMLFQDFGLFFLSKKIFYKVTKVKNIAFSISLSMRNIAVAAGILLFYNPIAAYTIIIGFIIHALFFNFIFIYREKLGL